MGLSVAALAALGVFGLVVGSFLNVVIVRLPDGGSLMSPPSQCPVCETAIAPRDNIPVVSWLLLRGRCRSCSEPIPAGYPLVELGNAVLWVIVGLRFGATWALVPMLILVSALLAQSVIDLELYRLLDVITFPVLGVSIVLIGVVSAVEGEPGRLLWALGGSVAYWLILLVPALIMPRGMGLGDVKLALLLGLFLGWLNPVLIVFALIAGCLLGIAAGLVVLAVRRTSEAYPFGPWLALGTLGCIVWSESILDVYAMSSPAFLAGP